MQADSMQNDIHVEIYALIGFIIFFTFFITVTIQAYRMKKDEVTKLSNMPLEDADVESNQK